MGSGAGRGTGRRRSGCAQEQQQGRAGRLQHPGTPEVPACRAGRCSTTTPCRLCGPSQRLSSPHVRPAQHGGGPLTRNLGIRQPAVCKVRRKVLDIRGLALRQPCSPEVCRGRRKHRLWSQHLSAAAGSQHPPVDLGCRSGGQLLRHGERAGREDGGRVGGSRGPVEARTHAPCRRSSTSAQAAAPGARWRPPAWNTIALARVGKLGPAFFSSRSGAPCSAMMGASSAGRCRESLFSMCRARRIVHSHPHNQFAGPHAAPACRSCTVQAHWGLLSAGSLVPQPGCVA